MRLLISSGSPYEPKVGISRAVRVGSIIAVSGTAPLLEGKTVGKGDPAAQARRCLDIIKEAPVVVDQWQLEKLALVTRKADILFYTPGLPTEYHKTLWGAIFSKPDDAIRALTQGLPANATIALMPEGPYVLAKTAAA